MNKQEFYAASLARDKALGKQAKWQLVGLFAVLFAPLLIFVAIPNNCTPASVQPILSYIVIGIEVCILVAFMYLTQHLRKRTNAKLGLICPSCGASFEGNLLVTVGFTDSCEKCGIKLFNGPNHSFKADGPDGPRP